MRLRSIALPLLLSSVVACSDDEPSINDGGVDAGARADGGVLPRDAGTTTEDCTNGRDDDGDDLVDCLDPSCATDPACPSLPPDPSTLAPAHDRTRLGGFAGSIEFLYLADPPVVLGLDPAALDPARVGVVRGRALDAAGQPVSGVRASFPGHPELGYTFSRADGTIDLVANGGQELVVRFESAAHPAVDRRLHVEPNEFSAGLPVVMTPYDTKANLVQPSAGPALASANLVQDADGERTARLYFPQGTTATIEAEGEATRTLSEFTVRATEFTVGETGEAAMPAALPEGTGYTYAVELSLDEARGLTTPTVRFSRTVHLYLDNFLDFPVGMDVPSGVYERQSLRWEAAPNGRIIEVLAAGPNGLELDLDGSGQAASELELQRLGVDPEERATMAQVLAPGDVVWRVGLEHFSPYDLNWPYAAETQRPGRPPHWPRPSRSNCRRSGSIIECPDRVLTQQLRPAGVPFTLSYRSDRVPDYGRRFELPLLGDPIENNQIVRVAVEIEVAGVVTFVEFLPTPGLSYEFEWDGLDAYGRGGLGRVPVDVTVYYIYEASYLEPTSFGGPGMGTFAETRREIPVATRFRGEMGAVDTQALAGLGGWAFEFQHFYDPKLQVMYPGASPERSDVLGADASGLVRTYEDWEAARPALAPLDPWGSPTLFPKLLVGRDGSLYAHLSTSVGGTAILRRAPDGTVEHVAGRAYASAAERAEAATLCAGGSGACGDGGPATEAHLVEAAWAIGPDDALYAASPAGCVRRIGADGVIDKWAGGCVDGLYAGIDDYPIFDGIAVSSEGRVVVSLGTRLAELTAGQGAFAVIAGRELEPEPSGDGGPAVDATLQTFHGWTTLTFDRQGDLYFTQVPARTIRRIDTRGVISTVHVSTADELRGLAPAPGGGIVFAEYRPSGDRVIALHDGIVRELAGVPRDEAGSTPEEIEEATFGENVPTARATFAAASLAVSPEGDIYHPQPYLADGSTITTRIRVIEGVLTEAALGGEATVASRDGTLLYRFTSDGHLTESLEALTGQPELRLGYDAEGRFVSATDVNDRVIAIERDGAGVATSIVGPFGSRTRLEHSADGFLSAVVWPSGARAELEYTAGGLLTLLRRPNGGESRYEYDSLGRLRRAEGPDGVTQTFTLQGGAVRVETSDGESLEFGEALTYGDGLSVRREEANGVATVTLPDGTVTTSRLGPDPRFGRASEYVVERSTTLPSGLAQRVHASRLVTLEDPEDPTSVMTLTLGLDIDGVSQSQRYDAAANTWTHLSAAGREITYELDARGRTIGLVSGGLDRVQLDYDALGRVTSVGDGVHAVSLEYDSGPRPTLVRDPLGRETLYGFDAEGRIVSETIPDGRTVTVTRDAQGSLQTLETPRGVVHRFSHDAIGRMTGYTAPLADQSYTIEYGTRGLVSRTLFSNGSGFENLYDSGGRFERLRTAEGDYGRVYDPKTGRVTALSSPDGAISLGYDGFVNTQFTQDFGPVNLRSDHVYDSSFYMTSYTLAGRTIEIDYDADRFPTRVGPVDLAWTPSSAGLISVDTGSIETLLSHDSTGRFVGRTDSRAGTELYATQLTLDAASRITRLEERVAGALTTWDYAYDLAGRLVAVERDGSTVGSFAYDDDDNIVSKDGLVQGYDEQNRLVTRDTRSYGYDVTGALATSSDGGQTTSYRYDVLGRLRSVTLPTGVVISYLYDGLGRRVGREVDGAFERGWFYDGGARPLAEVDSAGAVRWWFVYGSLGSTPDALISGTGVVYRVITDHRGSVRLVVEATTGAVAQALELDAFGAVLSDSAPDFQPFGFAGGLRDPVVSLVHFGGRDYDPTSGRWASRDPAGFAAGDPSLYAYANNDPINGVDASGWVFVRAIEALSDGAKGMWTYTDRVKGTALQAAADSKAYLGSDIGSHMGPLGALRHCAMNCRMTRSFGAGAARLASWHHEGPEHVVGSLLKGRWPPDNSINTPDRYQDEWNNDCGRRLAAEPGDCVLLCADEMETGGLSVMTPWSQADLTDLAINGNTDALSRRIRGQAQANTRLWHPSRHGSFGPP